MSYCVYCGANNLPEFRFCGRCGRAQDQQHATSAPVAWGSEPLSKRRKRQIGALEIGASMLVLVMAGYAAYWASSTAAPKAEAGRPIIAPAVAVEPAPRSLEPAAMNSPAIAPTAAQPEALAIPADEANFVAAVSSFAPKYEQAANEFQKSAIRRERATAMAQLMQNLDVTGWRGKVLRMETTGDGSGILYVSLPSSSSVTVETWNNRLSDARFGTLIRPGSEMYSRVSSFAVGAEIVFSGRFWPSDLDYLHEISLTESGSMTDPEFLFRFTGIAPRETEHQF